jgi:hypothetical protein
MKLKNAVFLVFLSMMLVFSISTLIYAQENSTSPDTNESENNSLISPIDLEDLNESDAVGPIRMGWKQVGIWFTFNQERKAELELELARLRLIQAKIAARNNNSVAMEKALEAHQRLIEKVQERMTKLQENNRSIDKLVGLQRAVEVHQSRMLRLEDVLNNSNLGVQQRDRIMMQISKAGNVTQKIQRLEIRIQQRRDSSMELGDNRTQEERDRIRNRDRNITSYEPESPDNQTLSD